MTPFARPGALTDAERFLFDVAGYLVIPDALSPGEVAACLKAAKHAHSALPRDQWRQIGAVYEQEPAMEGLPSSTTMCCAACCSTPVYSLS